MRFRHHPVPVIPALLGALLVLLAAAPRLGAQETVFRIRTTYVAGGEPAFVVLPFGGEGAAARAIVRRDLDFSDRFRIRDGAAALRPGSPLPAPLAQDSGADWVLAGEVSPRSGGVALRLALYDAKYASIKEDRTFALPSPGAAGFRMAVHAVSDEVVRWVTGEPGMAATRIAFVRPGRGGRTPSKEIYLVDSDGEGVQRLTSDGSIALSPAWSPDGRRIAYTSFREGTPALYERDLASGQDRVVSRRDGINITPAYAPDGRTLAFATTMEGNTEIVTYDRERGCCMEPVTRGRRSDSLSPTFSPDGRQMAFVSNRLGEPHVYVTTLGGQPRLLSQYRYGGQGYNTSPDWSPRGDRIAFHTRSGGSHQIAVVNAAGDSLRVLTSGGANEDPSWAPDGRHLVFAASGRDAGLYVVDVVSGRTRTLVRGHLDGLPDWSPVLVRAAVVPSAGR